MQTTDLTPKPQPAGILLTVCLLLVGCGPTRAPTPSTGHLLPKPTPAQPGAAIPPPVTRPVLLPEPRAEAPLESYTVVVSDVPLRELLFTLARDAGLNLDIDNNITGNITLNAVDQTLPRILDRITRLSAVRYEIDDDVLRVMQDTPFLRSYIVDYVNLSRQSSNAIQISTKVASKVAGGEGGEGEGNTSNTQLKGEVSNRFWQSLFVNLTAIIGDKNPSGGSGSESGGVSLGSPNIIINAETGMIAVRTTAKKHQEIERFLIQVLDSARRQVLIEVTIAEVVLSDHFQAGVDWSLIGSDIGINSAMIGQNLLQAPLASLTLSGNINGDPLNLTLKALENFGKVKVLSSPKIMTLNNQPAVLRVTDQRVYMITDVEVEEDQETKTKTRTFETTVNTVPEGLVLTVTPYVDQFDTVMLNIRPTISRILGFVEMRNQELDEANVINRVPEIQLREMETVLRVSSGDSAIIGGLMQDAIDNSQNSLPGVTSIPLLGDLFSYHDKQVSKTELVVFIRPTVIHKASLQDDLKPFRTMTQDLLPAADREPGEAL